MLTLDISAELRMDRNLSQVNLKYLSKSSYNLNSKLPYNIFNINDILSKSLQYPCFYLIPMECHSRQNIYIKLEIILFQKVSK